MTRPTDGGREDPALERLLERTGLAAQHRCPDPLTSAEQARAQLTLEKILQPQSSAPSRRMPLLTALLVLVVAATALTWWSPFGGTSPAAAKTPALLAVGSAQARHLPSSGASADAVLREMASTSAGAEGAADLPVQHLRLTGWSSTLSQDEKGEATSAELRTTTTNLYVFRSNELETTVRWGPVIDSAGAVTKVGSTGPRISRTVTSADASRPSDFPETLPRSPAAIRERLVPASSGEVRGGLLLESAASVFQNYVVPPTIASRIWTALEGESSITDLGTTSDRLGRSATVLSAHIPSRGIQILVLIDPETGTYLGSEQVLVSRQPGVAFAPPAVLSFQLVTSVERVSRNLPRM